MAIRKRRLLDSLQAQQLFRDLDDEAAWIREKEPIIASTNRGKLHHNLIDNFLALEKGYVKSTLGLTRLICTQKHFPVSIPFCCLETLFPVVRKVLNQNSMDRGFFNDPRKVLDGGGSKPFTVVFYGGGLFPAMYFPRAMSFLYFVVTSNTTLKINWVTFVLVRSRSDRRAKPDEEASSRDGRDGAARGAC